MSIMVKFDKSRAEYFLRCLNDGEIIAPPEAGWTGNDMLALAGACLFGAMSQGPESFWLRDVPKDLHPEHLEASEEKFDHDLHAAIGFYEHLTRLVADGLYDDDFAPMVAVQVTQQGDLHRVLTPIKGVKGHPDRV